MTDPITHFDDEAWHGFVRGILPATDEQVMRAHLDRGCAECRESLAIWSRFVKTASREGFDATTSSANGFAEAVFALRRKVPFRAGVALFAQRVFDSLRDPSPVGIRGSAAAPRQLEYEAGGYLIDLQLEQTGVGFGTLTGQVVHAWSEGATYGAGIVLLHDDSVIGQTVANSIGEFQFDCEYWDNLRICLGIADGTFIEVLLPNPISGQSPMGGPKETPKDHSEPWKKRE
jgi:hypothetical protein